MTKFRKGDVCTIDVIVTSSFNETQVCVKPVDGYQDVYLKPLGLTMLRPKFEAGDRVRWQKPGFDQFEGEVIAINGDHLWVDLGGGDFATVWASTAERVNPEPSAGAEAA